MRDGLLCSISSSFFFFFPPPPAPCRSHRHPLVEVFSLGHLFHTLALPAFCCSSILLRFLSRCSSSALSSSSSARSCPLPVAFCVLLTQLPLPPPPRPAYKRRGQQPTDTPHPREEDGLSTCHDGSLAALLSLPCTGVRCLSPSVARFPSAGFTPGFTFACVFFSRKRHAKNGGCCL